MCTSPSQQVAHHKPEREYLVKWKGYGPARNSWEPQANVMEHAQKVVQDYWASRSLNDHQVVETRKRTEYASVPGTDSKREWEKETNANQNATSKKRQT